MGLESCLCVKDGYADKAPFCCSCANVNLTGKCGVQTPTSIL